MTKLLAPKPFTFAFRSDLQWLIKNRFWYVISLKWKGETILYNRTACGLQHIPPCEGCCDWRSISLVFSSFLLPTCTLVDSLALLSCSHPCRYQQAAVSTSRAIAKQMLQLVTILVASGELAPVYWHSGKSPGGYRGPTGVVCPYPQLCSGCCSPYAASPGFSKPCHQLGSFCPSFWTCWAYLRPVSPNSLYVSSYMPGLCQEEPLNSESLMTCLFCEVKN